MKRSLIKIAAAVAIVALGGVAVAHDARAWGRFNSVHAAEAKRSASAFDDRGRRIFYDRKGRRITKPATVCRCSELSCCDGD
jgi:hypothetical protein